MIAFYLRTTTGVKTKATSLIPDVHDVELRAISTALTRILALIAFNPGGTFIHADENFRKTLGNNGTVIYIQTTYKTIVDLDDKPYNKVKSAIDMTEQVDLKTPIQTKAESDACDKIISSDAKIAAR